MMFFPQEYGLNEVQTGEGHRRLALRRRLCWYTNFFCLYNEAQARITSIYNSINYGINQAWEFISGSAIASFASAVSKVKNFITFMTELIRDWAAKVREWIVAQLRALGEAASDVKDSVQQPGLSD